MRILVIEDDRTTGDYILAGLRQEGHVVDLSRNGRDGLLTAQTNDFDVLVVDRMPGFGSTSGSSSLLSSGMLPALVVVRPLLIERWGRRTWSRLAERRLASRHRLASSRCAAACVSSKRLLHCRLCKHTCENHL